MAEDNKDKKEPSRLRKIFNLKSGRNKAAAVLIAGTLAVGGVWGTQEMSQDRETYVNVVQKEEHITRVFSEVISERTEFGPHRMQIPDEELQAMQRDRDARLERMSEDERRAYEERRGDEPQQERFRTVVGEHTTTEVLESDSREQRRLLIHTSYDGTFELQPAWLQGQFNSSVRDLWNSIDPDYSYDFETFRNNPFSAHPNISNVEDTWYTKQRKDPNSYYYDGPRNNGR